MTYASATSAKRSNYQPNHNSVRFNKARTTIGPISNFVILLIMACLLAVVYLSQVTRTNNYSYSLQSLTEQRQLASDKHDGLIRESARLQSIERIKQSQVASGLTQPAETTFVN